MSLNLNQGTARTLVNNTGITTALAKAIVNYRKQKQDRPISDIRELWNIKGMSLPDFRAISSAFEVPEVDLSSEGPITPHTKHEKSPRHKKSPERYELFKDGEESVKFSSRRKQRNRKKKKRREEQQLRQVSPSPNRGSVPRGSKRATSVAKNRNKAQTMGSTGSMFLPNLFLKSDTDTPHNTLLRLTAGNGPDAQKVMTPVSVEKSPDGTGLIVMYREASQDSTLPYSFAQAASSMPPRIVPQLEIFSKSSRANSPIMAMNKNSMERGRRHHSNDSSRSRMSTSPIPEIRSKSSPGRADLSRVQVTKSMREECGTPYGSGTRVMQTEFTEEERRSDESYDHVASWLKTVHDSNLIDKSSVGKGKQSNLKDTAASVERGSRKKLDFAKAGPSGVETTILRTREKSPKREASPKSSLKGSPGRDHQSRNTSKKLIDTWQEARVSSKEHKKPHGKSDQSRSSRNKSRPRWNNKISPAKINDADERRPIEARMDRRHDRPTEVTEEMRRHHKQAMERRQARHRHRSRARSREGRRRLFNCSIM